MNLSTCCRILDITQIRLAEKMRITPRVLRYRLAKAGEEWDKSTRLDTRTVDMFTQKSRREEALAQFDYLLHDFMHRTGRQRKAGLKGAASHIFGADK